MVRIAKVLCPIDFSDTSRAAMAYAVDVAGRYDAALMLLHIYAAPGYTLPEGMIVAGPVEMLEISRAVHEAMETWKAAAAALGAKEVQIETALGSTHNEILRVAKEGAFDLIVMGTHGRTGLSRVLLGSTAENVVRHSSCPVMTVRLAAASEVPT
jgi:nucleotide-binding universal stress UspA family protein